MNVGVTLNGKRFTFRQNEYIMNMIFARAMHLLHGGGASAQMPAFGILCASLLQLTLSNCK
jgi:hypothetical protein